MCDERMATLFRTMRTPLVLGLVLALACSSRQVIDYKTDGGLGEFCPDMCSTDLHAVVYVVPLFGTRMRQTALIEQGGVRVIQETDWSRAEQVLVRR